MSGSSPVRSNARGRSAGRINWPLRWWLLSFLLGVAVLSFFFFGILPLFMDDRDSPGPQLLKDRVVDEWEQWNDKTWQEGLAEELQREGMEAELYDASGQLLFSSESVPSPGPSWSLRWRGVNRRWVDVIEVFRDSSPVGRAHMAHRWLGTIDNRGLDWRAAATMLAVIIGSALLMSIAGIWLLSRIFLKPLRQLSVAAGQIRHGDLDVRFPSSGVREVGVLIDDFRRMTDGLRQSIGRQAVMEEERRFFLAAASHDLRSPLFALRGRLEGIRDGLARSSEEVDHYVRSALDRIGILERLVADLFMYSQVDVLE